MRSFSVGDFTVRLILFLHISFFFILPLLPVYTWISLFFYLFHSHHSFHCCFTHWLFLIMSYKATFFTSMWTWFPSSNRNQELNCQLQGSNFLQKHSHRIEVTFSHRFLGKDSYIELMEWSKLSTWLMKVN